MNPLYAKVREKIGKRLGGVRYNPMLDHVFDPKMRLEHVLVAIGLEKFHNDDKVSELIHGYVHSWDMFKDLSGQSDDTLAFLDSLLG